MTTPRDHIDTIYKFGLNADSDTGDDIWSAGGAYPFPSAATTTTIESSSALDTAAGVGARTVKVFGLDTNWAAISETATLNGATPVELSNDYLRVFRAYVVDVGTAGLNSGTISIKHSSTTIAEIPTSRGQTLMAIYSLAANTYGYLYGWRASADGVSAAEIHLQTRILNQSWRTRDIIFLDTAATTSEVIAYPNLRKLDPQSDIRLRAISGGNNLQIAGQFDLVESDVDHS